MEAKPESFIEVQNNIGTQKPKTIFWSSIVAGSIQQDVCLISQW